MKMKRYTFPVEALSHTRRVEGVVETRLAPSDIPVAFEVGTERDGPRHKMRVAIVYPTAPAEPEITEVQGVVRAALGRHSRRLLSIEITWEDNPPDQTRLVSDIFNAISKLRAREANEGTRMNYDTAQAALEIGEGLPPAWLIEAMNQSGGGSSSWRVR